MLDPVQPAARTLLERGGGLATTAQLLTTMTRRQLDVHVKNGALTRVWSGVYTVGRPDLFGRLGALDLHLGLEAVVCLGTAASLYGFDVQDTTALHVLDPGARLRPTVGLSVHQRLGAPLRRIGGRLATAPAWTAVEVARQLKRPRALATLDAALRSRSCTVGELDCAIREQRGRRGIVAVRDLLPFADGRAESAMESETRLVMIDYNVPVPELQYEIDGRDGELWRVDFAWPQHRLAAEYESIEWHSGPEAMRRDKMRFAGIQDADWTVIPIVKDDVRVHPWLLADRLKYRLVRSTRSA